MEHMKINQLGGNGIRLPPSVAPAALAATPSPGAHRTIAPPSPPSTRPSTSASIGSTPPPFTASAIPRRSSAAPSASLTSSLHPLKCGIADEVRSAAPCSKSAASAKTASAASRSNASTSTRSTGPSRTRTSKRAGPPWPTSRKRARSATSAFRFHRPAAVLEIAPIASLQPPYSMINRAAEAEILPFCLDHAIGVINYSPMHSGWPPARCRRSAHNPSHPTISAARLPGAVPELNLHR